MGKSLSERREIRGITVNVFSSNVSLGWQVMRQASAEVALEMIALKKWREIWYEDGTLAGVQPLKPEERKTLSQVLVERLIAVTITNPELKRNAGLYGKSHTLGMPEWRRLQRHVWQQVRPAEGSKKPQYIDTGKIAAPEDLIERAIEKVKQWPFPQNRIGTDKHGEPIFGDRAIRVYPIPPQGGQQRRKA